MKRALQLLVAGTLAFGLAVSFPAYRIGGAVGLATAVLAGLLCLLPTTATLLWAGWARDQSPQRQLAMVLGGTGLRMAVVLGAGLAMSPYYPAVVIAGLRGVLGFLGNSSWAPAHEPTATAWWEWVLAFYLVTLALEVGILVVARSPRSVAPASRRYDV